MENLMFKKGFTHLVKALRKNQSSAKLMQPPSRFLLTGLRCARPSAFTLSCKSFRSNPLTALLRSRLSRFSQTKFRSLAAHSCGFTLAEVLITLSILGIVAAISVPNIIQQYQKRLTITKLQKAYANLEIAATNLSISTGCIGRDFACTNLSSITDNDEFQKKFFELSGMNTQKLYRFLSYKRGAAPLSCLNSGSKCTGETGTLYNIDFYGSKDNIGYAVKKEWVKTFDQWGYFPNWTRKQEYKSGMVIYVFLDSKKLKNLSQTKVNSVLGKDSFVFVLYGNFQVEPAVQNSEGSIGGAMQLSSSNASNILDLCNKDNSGFNCAAKIVKDGWKINY